MIRPWFLPCNLRQRKGNPPLGPPKFGFSRRCNPRQHRGLGTYYQDVLEEEQTAQFAKYLRVYTNLLQNILFGAPRLTESVYVWRGIQDNQFVPSGIVSCSARVTSSPSRSPSVKRVSFSSSTTELETAHGEDYTNRDTGCCLEFLHLPPGLPFPYVDKISDYEGEDEVILPLNVTFQYLCESGTKIGDTTVYFVDVIPETPYL